MPPLIYHQHAPQLQQLQQRPPLIYIIELKTASIQQAAPYTILSSSVNIQLEQWEITQPKPH
jgi:hypothetical protein